MRASVPFSVRTIIRRSGTPAGPRHSLRHELRQECPARRRSPRGVDWCRDCTRRGVPMLHVRSVAGNAALLAAAVHACCAYSPTAIHQAKGFIDAGRLSPSGAKVAFEDGGWSPDRVGPDFLVADLATGEEVRVSGQ